MWIGNSIRAARLTGIFLFGSAFYLWRQHLRLSPAYAAISVVLLTACLFVSKLAEPAIATCGAYLIFAFSGWCRTGFISRINNRDDISYGVYLYAWPVEKLLLWYWPGVPLVIAGLITLVVACLCGWLSWHCLEKPVMRRLLPFSTTGAA